MNYISIPLSECKPGNILYEDLYDSLNNRILSKNTVIGESQIENLNKFGIKNIKIIKEANIIKEDNILNNHFENTYNTNTNNIKNLFNDFASQNKVNYKIINEVADTIFLNMESNFDIIQCISQLEDKNDYLYHHSLNVSLYSLLIARWLKLDEKAQKECLLAGLLHDIGKIKIPDKLLGNPGQLTASEFAFVKKHTTFGYFMIKDNLQINNSIKEAVLHHHERVDGAGYPDGLSGNKLNIYTKIVSLADVYDAITSTRSYKKRNTPFEAFHELVQMGYNNFDPQILMTFLDNISSYYINTKVLMNTGEIGTIVFVPSQNIQKPIIQIGEEVYDLNAHPELYIVELVD